MDMENLLDRFTDSYLPKGDILCRLPFGVPLEPFWQKLLDHRKTKAILLPLHNAAGMPLWYVQTNKMIDASVKLSEAAAKADDSFDPYRAKITPELRQELYFTSFVEGAQIDFPDAMQFFEDHRKPRNVQEQMLQNNGVAWETLMLALYRPLDDQIVRTLAFQLTDEMAGAADDYRKQDRIRIPAMAEEPYIVPPAGQIPALMAELFRFLARQDVHPLIQASAAQAFLLITRPFPDGDERLGRMASYQILIHSGYSFFKNVSLSRLIARRSYAYFKAMREILRQENGGDITYFMEYYLQLLSDAVDHIGECETTVSIQKPEPLAPAAVLETPPVTVVSQESTPRVASVQFEQSRLTVNLTHETQPATTVRSEPIEATPVEEESLQKMPARTAEVIQAGPFVGAGSEQVDYLYQRTMLNRQYGAVTAFFLLYNRFGTKRFSSTDAISYFHLAESSIWRLFKVLRVIDVMTAVEQKEILWFELNPDPSNKKMQDCNWKKALANEREQCLRIVEHLRYASTDMGLPAKDLMAYARISSYRFDIVIQILRLCGAIKRYEDRGLRQLTYQYTGRAVFDASFIREVFMPMNSLAESINHAISILDSDSAVPQSESPLCKGQAETGADSTDAGSGPLRSATECNDVTRILGFLKENFSQPFSVDDAQKRLQQGRSTLYRNLMSLSWAGDIFRYRPVQGSRVLYSFEKRPSFITSGITYTMIDYTGAVNNYMENIRNQCGDCFTLQQLSDLTRQGKESIAIGVNALMHMGLCVAEITKGHVQKQFRLLDQSRKKGPGQAGKAGYEAHTSKIIAAASAKPGGQTIQFR